MVSNIFPEGTEIEFFGVCGSYYLTPKEAYRGAYGAMEYPWNEQGGRLILDDCGFEAIPRLDNTEYRIKNTHLKCLSPDIVWPDVIDISAGNILTGFNSDEDKIFYFKYPIKVEKGGAGYSDGYLLSGAKNIKYLSGVEDVNGSLKAFYFEPDYNSRDIVYLGPCKGIKCKILGDWNYPGIAECGCLSVQSYIDIFNGLYDFTAAGETPTSEQGEIKLHPRAFKILTPEELAIPTAKGWTVTQA